MGNMNFDNSMQARVKRSLGDYEKARSAFLKAKENLKTYSSDSNDEIAYDALKECTNNLFQTVDAFLRYFCMKYSVPVTIKTKNGEDTFVLTEENEKFKHPNTYNFCSAIADYQRTMTDERVKNGLQKLDFSSFLNEKEYRNDIEHYTLISGMGDFYRTFYNLRLLINLFDSKIEITLPAEDGIEFDFQGFRSCLVKFDNSQSNFLLICDSVHNIGADGFSYLMQIPWRIVFDMDAMSDIGGLKDYITQKSLPINDIPLSTLAAVNQALPINSKPFYINLPQESGEVFASRGTVKGENIRIREFIEKLYTSTVPNYYIVVMSKNTKRIDKIIESVGEITGEVDIIYLTLQEFEKSKPLNSDDSDCIRDTYHITGDFFNIFKSLKQNQTYLKRSEQDTEDQNILRLPSDGIEVSKLVKTEMEQKYGSDFDILHLDLGNDTHGCSEIDFFKGGIATWEIIKNKNARPLVNDSKYRDFAARIRQSLQRKGNEKSFYIFHKPGFGGTTLGRILAWDLHEDFAVIKLNKYSLAKTKVLLESFYRTIGKVSYLVVMDENDFSESDIIDLEKLSSDIEIPISFLFIKRVSDADYNKINRLH